MKRPFAKLLCRWCKRWRNQAAPPRQARLLLTIESLEDRLALSTATAASLSAPLLPITAPVTARVQVRAFQEPGVGAGLNPQGPCSAPYVSLVATSGPMEEGSAPEAPPARLSWT
jgi:hypothetical protein